MRSNERLYVNTIRFLRDKGLHWASRCVNTDRCTTPLECAILALKECLNGIAIVGIDPGSQAGLALTVNNILVYSWEGPMEEVISMVVRLSDFIDVVITGKGWGREFEGKVPRVIEVEESSTSKTKVKFPQRVGKHARAAYLIALRKPITSLRGYKAGKKS